MTRSALVARLLAAIKWREQYLSESAAMRREARKAEKEISELVAAIAAKGKK
jgi:hypothetical protein